MALSRKRRKELNRLKSQAEDLWEDQKELIDHASKVVRDARRQAAHFAREEVAPRVRDTYEDRVRPAFESGVSSARSAARTAGKRFSDDVLPAMTRRARHGARRARGRQEPRGARGDLPGIQGRERGRHQARDSCSRSLALAATS